MLSVVTLPPSYKLLIFQHDLRIHPIIKSGNFRVNPRTSPHSALLTVAGHPPQHVPVVGAIAVAKATADQGATAVVEAGVHRFDWMLVAMLVVHDLFVANKFTCFLKCILIL